MLDTIVYAESMNIWAMLMPAVYQLVPGSMIARMWFETIIPPTDPTQQDNTFAGLMVTSISLALGLIVGEAMVEIISGIFQAIFGSRSTKKDDPPEEEQKEAKVQVTEASDGAVAVAVDETSEDSTWPL